MFILRSYKSVQKSRKSVYDCIKVYKIIQQSSTQTKTLILVKVVTKGIAEIKVWG